MTTGARRLRAMHAGPQPLILPNVWDPVSARSFAEAGFAAVATSSSAIAATLGYVDGQTPADEMFAAIARIAASVSVPVTADIEAGYGLPPAELVRRLADCGVAGCNLEDSDPVTRTLIDPVRHAEFLAAVRAEAGLDLVINARVDVYLRPIAAGAADGAGAGDGAGGADDGDPVTAAAVARAGAYLAAGADCTYPILAPPEALPELVRRISGPVNVLYTARGPSLAQLAALGVARITFGGGLHARAAGLVRDMASELAAEAAASRSDG
ncbi:MAG TPA: isocitrate lyase/phosphoenolpyruvate mutase family protein [Streptosporangiaceae bacterium]|nr:isocitrate lyase/phosphoenolpyruvate mutase family protein [Streptosporangiaceae bacterium]